MPGETPYGSLGGQPIVSCSRILREFMQAGLDYSPFYRRANSYTCRTGSDPGMAYVLMTRDNLIKLDSRQPQDLKLGIGDKSVTIKRLAVIQAQRIVTSASNDPSGLYLVTAADVRWFLKRTHINRRYNIREACSDSAWCTGSLYDDDPETPFTFLQVIESIWNDTFTAFGGFFPTPYSTFSSDYIHDTPNLPTKDPENLRFEGISAMDAIEQVCQQCGFFIRYDPLVGDLRFMKIGLASDPAPGADGDYTVGFGGAIKAINANSTLKQKFALTPNTIPRTGSDDLSEDTECFVGSPYIPATISVVFPTNDLQCGSFCDIDDSHGWFLTKSVSSSRVKEIFDDELADPSNGLTADSYAYMDEVAPSTEVTLYSTYFARFDDATSATAVNNSDLITVAEQMATDYYRALGYQANGRVVFREIKEIVPGPTINEVAWRDYGDGLKTEIARWPLPVGVNKPPKQFSGGGGCTAQSAWVDVSVFGTPTGGDFDLDWTFNGVEETITHDYNGNAANFATELATHSEVASSDFDVVGGPLPNATIRVKFKATQENIDISIPIADWNNLTGGVGVGVIAALAQKGHAG